MTDPRKSGGITMDKAIERDIDRETGADRPSGASRPDGDDPRERGRQANERQVHQGEAGRDAALQAGEGGEEDPGMAQGSGKTGKAPKGGKDSGAGNEPGGGPSDSGRSADSA